MRIDSLRAVDVPPIREFGATALSGIVILAGANGSGKTRLKEALLGTLRNPKRPLLALTLAATRPQEETQWGAAQLTVAVGQPSDILKAYMATRTSGGTYVGTLIQIDSSRTVQPISFTPLNLSTPDPDDAEIQHSYYLDAFASRWPSLVNKIFQKAASRDGRIVARAKARPDLTAGAILDEHPDPFLQYQDLFARLLPGKRLAPIDPRAPKEFEYSIEGRDERLPFSTLSSGEQEVVKVAFDLAWKQIRHCVILIDEPELHLHPTLLFRLIETIKALGDGTNQLILFTHSADLISTYYATSSVYFIDPDEQSGNQAKQLSDIEERHRGTGRLAAANLGIFAVGRKLLFVEGRESSIDRLTYHRLAQVVFPELYVWPVGSVSTLLSLRDVVEELSQTLFGIDLFMLRDRDGLSENDVAALEQSGRMRCLRRRHVENYFLDAEVLSHVAELFYLSKAKQDVAAIETALFQVAQKTLKQALVLAAKDYVEISGAIRAPVIKHLDAKTIDEIEQEALDAILSGVAGLTAAFAPEAARARLRTIRAEFEASLASSAWRVVLPGKPIFADFCASFFQVRADRVRQAYLDIALQRKRSALQDIVDILEHFRSV